MSDRLVPTDRTRLRRRAQRGDFDVATIDAILDEAYVAHVGVVVDGAPRVLPITSARVGDALYLHGAAANAMLRAAAGTEVCVTITLLDGLVLARAALTHSMNYRSVVVFGTAVEVTDDVEKRAALDAIVEHALPGRAAEARPATAAEVRSTLVLRVPIVEASAKVRAGGPNDADADLDRAVWAGHVPLRLVPGPPVPDERLRSREVSPPAPASLAR
jgi:uncharacterized protein